MINILSIEPQACDKLKLSPLVVQQKIKEMLDFLDVRLYAEREVAMVELDLEQRQSMIEQFDQMIAINKLIKSDLYIKFEQTGE